MDKQSVYHSYKVLLFMTASTNLISAIIILTTLFKFAKYFDAYSRATIVFMNLGLSFYHSLPFLIKVITIFIMQLANNGDDVIVIIVTVANCSLKISNFIFVCRAYT
jgi:hypothetical protein